MTRVLSSNSKAAKFSSLCVIGSVAALVSGCAALSPFETGTGISTVAPMPVAQASYASHESMQAASLFESRDRIYDRLSVGDATLNHAFLRTRTAMTAPVQGEDAAGRFAPTLARDSKIGTQPRPVSDPLSSDPASSDADLTLVKSDGSVSVADWDQCAQQTGGVFDKTHEGFELSTGFSSCMRAKGYITENELLAELTPRDTVPFVTAVPVGPKSPTVAPFSVKPLSSATTPPVLRSFRKSPPKLVPVEKLMQDEALAGGPTRGRVAG